MVYYLPISGPANYTVNIGGKDYAFKFEYPELPIGTPGEGGGGNPEPGVCDTTGVNTYPNWPQSDWGGNPSHANQGDKMIHEGVVYKATGGQVLYQVATAAGRKSVTSNLTD
ncbi:chitodextrinase precursor [Photobacterium aphoticum]|uniref:Chitodextrinase n=1 Tax=Photobacterium aphoticum TaxID=754436 RepID=A0A090RMD8_9GAMM|nr:chitodextrinase precursor [Photobacterium aphoticum]